MGVVVQSRPPGLFSSSLKSDMASKDANMLKVLLCLFSVRNSASKHLHFLLVYEEIWK